MTNMLSNETYPCTAYEFSSKDDDGSLIVKNVATHEIAVFPQSIGLELGYEPKMIMVLGLANAALAVAAARVTQYVVVYEPSGEYAKSFLSHPSSLHLRESKSIHLIVGDHIAHIHQSIRRWLMDDVVRLAAAYDMLVFESPNVHTLDSEYRRQFDQFTRIFSDIVNELRADFEPYVEDAYRGLVNTLRFAPVYRNFKSFHDLKNIYAGKTGFAVASGPSLKMSIPYIKQLRDKVVLFCCDSSAKVLIQNGIIPDFVASLERDGAIGYLFQNLPELNQSCLVAPSVLAQSSIESFPGNVLHFHRLGMFDHWIYDDGFETIQCGVSSSHLCVVGLNFLGCDQIFLMGQDAAYDPETGESHSSDVSDHVLSHGKMQREHKTSCKVFSVSGYDNKLQWTNQFWLGYQKIHADLVRTLNAKVYHVMPSHFGLPIYGAQRYSPQDIVKFAPQEDIKKVHVQIVNQNRQHASPSTHLASRIHHLARQARSVLDLCLSHQQKISDMCNEHDPMLESIGKTDIMNRFVAELDVMLQNVMNAEDGFFDRYLLSVLHTAYLDFMIEYNKELNQLRKTATKDVMIKKQIQRVQGWYSTMIFWLTRIEHLLRVTENSYKGDHAIG